MDYKEIEKRIDELNLDGYKHIKNNDWEIPKKLKLWLQDHEFKKIGEGLYSSVFVSEDEDFVVKVNDGHIDPSYLSFVELCQSNKGNPHLPKVGKIKKYENWYIIFIEKLEPINDEYLGLKNDGCWVFFNKIIDLYDDNINEYDYRITQIYNRYSNGRKLSSSMLKQFIDISELMFKFKKDIGKNSLDLHSGNIMRRGNTLVVTDPAV